MSENLNFDGPVSHTGRVEKRFATPSQLSRVSKKIKNVKIEDLDNSYISNNPSNMNYKSIIRHME